MKTHKHAALLSALLVFSISPSATAEPITAVFDVTTFERTHQSGPPEPFVQTFPLLMIFDPARGTEVNPYGLQSFSEIPLPAAQPFPGVPIVVSTQITRHGSVFSEDLIADVSAEAVSSQLQITFTPGGDIALFFDRVIQLRSFVFDVMGPLPPFTAETFPVHLGTLGDAPWNFFYGVGRSTDGEASRDSYFGTMTFRELQTPEPIPEPATLLLVGGGLALLMKRRLGMSS